MNREKINEHIEKLKLKWDIFKREDMINEFLKPLPDKCKNPIISNDGNKSITFKWRNRETLAFLRVEISYARYCKINFKADKGCYKANYILSKRPNTRLNTLLYENFLDK